MAYRLDRNAFHMGSHTQTEQYHAEQQPDTPIERLRAAAYLNSVAYRYELASPPRLDGTVFKTRKHTA